MTGTLDLGNANQGIAVYLTSNTNTVIGGTAAGAGNVISGNGGEGVRIQDAGTTGTLVQGNKIGTNAAGTAAIPNTNAGVRIDNADVEQLHRRHGGGRGQPHRLQQPREHRRPGGIYLTPTAGTGNSILGNAIYSNGGLGIDLNQDGVTLNDALDPDGGPNSRLNFPRILAVHASAGTLTVHFSLDVPAGSYRIEFFKNPSGTDPSGYGEGEVFAASTSVTHAGGGAAFFINAFAGSLGDRITATATACAAPCTLSFGSTSEFAQALNATTAVTLAVLHGRGSRRGGGARLGNRFGAAEPGIPSLPGQRRSRAVDAAQRVAHPRPRLLRSGPRLLVP